MENLNTSDITTHKLCDTEVRIIDAIKDKPNLRKNYVDLAKVLESKGLVAESAIVYRGSLPNSIQDRHRLDPYPREQSARMSSCRRLGRYEVERIPLSPPLNEDAMRNSVFLDKEITTLPEYIDLIDNCILLYDGFNKLTLDEDGVRNAEHSTVNAYLLTSKALDKSQSTYLAGLTVLLARRNAHNFYHWHFDCLPALALIEDAGIALSDIDHFLIDDKCQGFQKDMLLMAGVKEKQIKIINPNHAHFVCEQSLLIKTYNQQGMSQRRRHLEWMRNTFQERAISQSPPHTNSRSKIAIKREIRGFSDPNSTYKLLEDMGYTCIQLENLAYHEQVRLFAEATHIVAPHGAGLSLLVYCQPETVVHEFYGEHVQPCFWSMASSLGLRYHNYNCSNVNDRSITSSNKNLGERLARTVNLSVAQLSTLSL